MSSSPAPNATAPDRKDARHVLIEGTNLPSITEMTVARAADYFGSLKLAGKQAKIAEKSQELQDRLKFLVDVGLNYLTLPQRGYFPQEKPSEPACQPDGAGLVGVMYILDEPSIGLHQRDNTRLFKTLFHLRDLGNTVIVVEHDEEAIVSADHIIICPGAGVRGEIVAEGPLSTIKKSATSLTGKYLSGKETIAIPAQRVQRDNKNS